MTMLIKIKPRSLYRLVHSLRDVRVIGLIVFGIIALLVTWSTLGAIQTNYELQKDIARRQEQNKIRELENANLKLRNEYFGTDQYLELAARRQFGKALPGETVVLVPESAALAKTVDIKQEVDDDQSSRPNKPLYQRNFEAWMDFFFRSGAGQ